MNKFDKELKKQSKNFTPPEQFQTRVDAVLAELPERNPYEKEQKRARGKKPAVKYAAIAAGVVIVFLLFLQTAQVANAGFLEDLKKTLLEFFHIEKQVASSEYGVESREEKVKSRPDLYVELKEEIVDKHSIYVLVHITAPTDISFDPQIGFDYFAFCKGESYNSDALIGGAKDCSLLQVEQDKSNEATFVVSISADETIEEDAPVTLYLKDMMRDPYQEDAEMLVEGMWSLTFPASYTVSKDVTIEGSADMKFEHDGGEVSLQKIELSPLGISVSADVTALGYADQAYSNATSLPVTLCMVDGSRMVIYSSDPEESGNTSMGSDSYSQPDGKEILTSRYEFEKMVDVSKVIGIYVEDYYVSLAGE